MSTALRTPSFLAASARLSVDGHEILPTGGHETPQQRPANLPTGGQEMSPEV